MSRRAATSVLVAVDTRDAYSNVALAAELKKRRLSPRDAALATELVYGVLKNRVFLDDVLNRWLKKPIAKMDPLGRAALRVGAYQLVYLDRIPAHAAISETVSLVKARKRWLSGLTNAVLRRVSENKNALKAELEAVTTDAASLGRGYGLPRKLAAELIERFGLDEAIEYAQSLQPSPPTTLRIRRPEERQAVLEELAEAGVNATLTPLSLAGIHVQGGGRLADLPPVRDGRAVVQSEGSQLCGAFADPAPASRVLDLCAGRGGKTFLLADLMSDAGTIVATDTHAGKLADLEGAAKSLGLQSIRVNPPRQREPQSALGGPFDLVLVDSPCSGAGNLRRHPELRWKMSTKRLTGLVQLQRELLDRGADLVAPGGLLVYIVCSDRPAEGEARATAFLETHPEFRRAPPPDNRDWSPLLSPEDDLTLHPHRHRTDGFYAVRLRRG